MRTDRSGELERVLADALAAQAFLFAEPAEAEGFDVAAESVWFCGRIGFEGHRSGLLEVTVPRGLAVEASANMLGDDDVEDDEAAADALGELINVICGQLLTSRFGTEPVFTLTMPEVHQGTGEEALALAQRDGCEVFDVDGECLLARFAVAEGG